MLWSYRNASTRTLTQEDPIGLAGGLNLYGFANGDPINFSDPFGLKVTVNSERLQAVIAFMRHYSGTFSHMYYLLKESRKANLHIQGCSVTRCDMDVHLGGGKYSFALGRQNIWIDDESQDIYGLIALLAHEVAHAATDASSLGWVDAAGCREGESREDCAVRIENEVRHEMGLESREVEEKLEGEAN